jgi:hypothetical protein
MKYSGIYQNPPALPQQQQSQASGGTQAQTGAQPAVQQKPYGNLYPEYDEYSQAQASGFDAYGQQGTQKGAGQQQNLYGGQGLQSYLGGASPNHPSGHQSQQQIPRNASPENSYKAYQTAGNGAGAGGAGSVSVGANGGVQDKASATAAGGAGGVAGVGGAPGITAGRGGPPHPTGAPRGIGAQQQFQQHQGQQTFYRGGYGQQQQQQPQQNSRPYGQPDQSQYYQSYSGNPGYWG